MVRCDHVILGICSYRRIETSMGKMPRHSRGHSWENHNFVSQPLEGNKNSRKSLGAVVYLVRVLQQKSHFTLLDPVCELLV